MYCLCLEYACMEYTLGSKLRHSTCYFQLLTNYEKNHAPTLNVCADIPDLVVLHTVPPTHIKIKTILFTQCNISWSKKNQVIFIVVKLIFLYTGPLIFMSVAYWQIVKVLWKSDIPGHNCKRMINFYLFISYKQNYDQLFIIQQSIYKVYISETCNVISNKIKRLYVYVFPRKIFVSSILLIFNNLNGRYIL